MSETTNFGQASLVVRDVGGPSMNVTSIRVSNTVLSFDSSTGSITANVYDVNGSLIRLSRIPIQIQSASQPASVGPGDEWLCTSNSNFFKYTSTIGWGCLGGYTPPPGVPSSLAAGTPTSTTIPFTWSVPSGTITTYTLTGAGISGGSVTFNYSTNPSSYTLTGLSPATSYGPFTLTANNTGGGASGASNQVGAVSTILDAPTSLNFTSVSATGFILNWTASSGAASYVLTNASIGASQTVSGTSATYSGLVANTNYGTITVTPYSGAGGTGTVGTAATSGTAGTLPNPPTSLSATATSPTTATVTFTGSVGGASSYTGGGGGSHSISGTTDTITGLSGSSTYTFTMYANGTFGNSTTASANQITTPSSGLYDFTNATFTSGGSVSNSGPSLSQARSGLSGTPAPSNWYNTYLNMSTQGFQLWTVPATGSYTIQAAGARGGNKVDYTGAGAGARVQGTFSLTYGQVLTIVIGQPGDDNGSTSSGGGGGGGGSFVFDSTTPYLIAGGGGGVGGGNSIRSNGKHGDVSRSGTLSQLDYAGGTGTYTYLVYATDGNGGWSYGAFSGVNDYDSGGGAGWVQNGYNGVQFPSTQGGRTRANSFLGGGYDSSRYPYVAAGGFGGGGAAADGGGGGGGYTGGNGGRWNQVASGGGSGGSYSSQTNPATGGLGTNNGSGYVTITKI